MPSTDISYEFSPANTADEKRRKLYLGIISIGEQCYTLGERVDNKRQSVPQNENLLD